MDINLTINFILAAVAIISLVVVIKQHNRKIPTWAYTTRQVIGRDAESPPELKYIFGEKEVKEVYQTKLILFNAGNDKYYGDLVPNGSGDIVEPIIIKFKGARILNKAIIKKKSKGVADKFYVNNIVNEIDLDSIELHFPFLGHNDGALIEVWHTKLIDKPDIPNANVKLLKDFNTARPKRFYRYVISASILVGFFLIMMGFVIANIKGVGDKIIAALPFIAFIGYMTFDTLKTFGYLRFPNWSRTALANRR